MNRAENHSDSRSGSRPDSHSDTGEDTVPEKVEVATVEALVRRQLSDSLGGRRGIVEAAIPGLIFTLIWLPTKHLELALVASLVVAAAALVVRLVQKGPTQYVFNAIFSIAIGWLFVVWAGHNGGSEADKALAYFLPGILYSLGYTIVLGLTCVVRWPMLGFMLGAATEDPIGWHRSPQIVKLCSRLTWVMLMPGAVGVLLQGPVWLLGHRGAISADTAVAIIAVLRLGLGWVLRIASWAAMVWLLARNATPLESEPEPTPEG